MKSFTSGILQMTFRTLQGGNGTRDQDLQIMQKQGKHLGGLNTQGHLKNQIPCLFRTAPLCQT